MAICFLCRQVLPDNYRKRKRVRSCPVAASVLAKISGKEISDSNALFCVGCEQNLNNIQSHEVKLAALRSTVVSHLQGHPEDLATDPRPTLQATPVRPFPPEEPLLKQSRLVPSTSSPSPDASPSVKVSSTI